MRTRIRIALLCLVLAPASAGAQGLKLRSRADSATWIGISGQLRVRGESWRGFGAGAPATADLDDAFALSRTLLRADAQWRGRFAAVAEIKSSLAASRTLPGGSRPADEDVVDLQQLYAEVAARPAGASAMLRAGRFDLALGRERLVSPLDWTNSRRVFQGFQLRAMQRGTELRVFWVEPISVRQRRPNLPDTLRQLYGLQIARGSARTRVEAYWLRNENAAAAFNGSIGAERRHTLGARFVRPPSAGRLDADLEAAWQTGTLGAANVRAWMVASQAGWSSGSPRGPRLYAGLDIASGDHSAGGAVQTFNQLFPLSHAYLGYIDLHGRQNITDVSVGASIQPLARLTVQLDAHDFRRTSTHDALYAADGSVGRPAGTGLPARTGSEIDLTIRRSGMASGHLAVQGGASRYFAGPFLRASGPARDITWVYTQLTASF
jgi:hypothetical protein